jgi:transposase
MVDMNTEGSMSEYVCGVPREQQVLLPESIEEYISKDNPVRIFEAFVNMLDMEGCGIEKAAPAKEGRPPYDPRDLLRLYIHGYFNGIRSSRKLMKACQVNLEVMWLMRTLTPDFRTIANFRKDNKAALKEIFKAFNKVCEEAGLFGKEYFSIDGSKFKAVNNKDRNFTQSKLDDRIKRLEEKIDGYLKELEENDEKEKEDKRELSREEIEGILKGLKERKGTYEGFQKRLEETGESQLSLTDPEAKLMKFKEGFEVGYNTQVAVDAKAHLIADFKVTDKPADHGQLEEVLGGVGKAFGLEITEGVADKGYQDKDDMMKCLEAGIIPNVIPEDGEDGFDLETEYEGKAIGEETRKSTKPEAIKACLRAGEIPEVYKGIVTGIRVEEKITRPLVEAEGKAPEGSGGLSGEEQLSRAKSGFFIRDIKRDLVYCPEGNILRAKAAKKDGSVRYYNKLACQGCGNKCTKSKWKEIDFRPGDTGIACAERGRSGEEKQRENRFGGRRETVRKKVVKIRFKVDRNKCRNRKCLSEHPFGTVKRAMGSSYLLLKGIAKVTGELSLTFMAYNMKRMINELGIRRILAILQPV